MDQIILEQKQVVRYHLTSTLHPISRGPWDPYVGIFSIFTFWKIIGFMLTYTENNKKMLDDLQMDQDIEDQQIIRRHLILTLHWDFIDNSSKRSGQVASSRVGKWEI